MKLTERELREIVKLLEQGKPLPDEYRFKLFDSDREVELVWNGKTNEVESVDLPFQYIEHVDEPRSEEDSKAQVELLDFSGRKTADWTNKLIWGDNKYILSSLKNGPLRQEIEDNGGIKLIYIDPPFDVGADFSMDIEIGGETLTKKASVLEEIAYRDTWGKGSDSFIAMIYERLSLMHDLLADNGTIYVHCDWRLNSAIRMVLDEIFGSKSFLNEIIWHYGGPSPVKTAYARKHDSILVFRKNDSHVFKPQYGELPEYLSERSKSDEDGRKWVDQNLGKLKEETIERLLNEGRIFETKTGKYRRKQYLDEMEGAQLDDVWNMPIINSQAKEDIGYPTQKPEALLERIIESSSKEGDIVLDVFAGSGTTLAVAEKLGRKWIGSDLGKFSIHSARKRMIGVQRQLKAASKSYRAFEILNLGKYQRQHFLSDNNQDLKDKQFVELILSAYKADRVGGFETFSGQKAGRMVALGPFNMQLSRGYVDAIVEEAIEQGISRVDILAFELEMGLSPNAQEEAKKLGVDLALKTIPADVFDKRAVEKGQVKFYDVAYIEVKPHIKGKSVAIELTDFSVFYNQDTDEGDLKSGSTKVVIRDGQVVKLHKDKASDVVTSETLTDRWTDWIDYWSVDFNFEDRKEIVRVFKTGVKQNLEGETAQEDIKSKNIEDSWTGNYIFENEWQSFRTKKDRDIELKTVLHEYAHPGKYKVAIKVVDIFGNDTMKVIDISL